MIYTSLQIILRLNLLMLTNILVLLSVLMENNLNINNVVVKVSRQIAVLRKIKYMVSRNFLENIYMTFIWPLLEYPCEVWDSCTVTDADRLEQLQLEAVRIVACNCNNYVENNEHYFLHCKLFVNQRNVMLNNIRDLGLDISINNILYGNSDFASTAHFFQLFTNTY